MISSIPNQHAKVRALLVVLLVFLIAKIIFSVFSLIAADEAYYWVWAENLAWSYFDHPPLNAWLIALTSYFFDNNVLAMRVPTFLTFAGTLYIYWLFAKRMYPETALYAFLVTTVAFLASPTLFVWTSIVYNDHLLIFLSLASMYAFADYFASYQGDSTTSEAPLYVAASILGVAALAKYNAAFLGISAAFLVIGHAKLRSMLFKPHIYMAAVLCVAMLAPVIYWNIQNEFASFQLHFSKRFDHALFTVFLPAPFFRFVLSTLIYFGPVLFIAVLLLYRPNEPTNGFAAISLALVRTLTALTLITFLILSSRGDVHWYWSSVAYAAMLPFLPMLLRKFWLLVTHLVYGAVFICYATFNYSYAPVEVLLGSQSAEVSRVYGWSEASRIARELVQSKAVTYLATTGYPTAGQLSHSNNSSDVYDLDPRPSHFTFVNRKSIPVNSNAIVLHDRFGNLEGTRKRFQSFELIESYTYKINGTDINTFDFFLAKGFKSSIVEGVKVD